MARAAALATPQVRVRLLIKSPASGDYANNRAWEHDPVILGLLAALLAAIAYGSGTVLQAFAVRAMAGLSAAAPLRTRIRTGWPYGLGLAVDGAGFIAALVAFRVLPLFLVESAIASSVAVTAALSAWLLGIRLSRYETLAVLGVVVGLALLGTSAQDGPAARVGASTGWLLLAATIAVGIVLGLGLLDRLSRRSALLLSTAAGLGFSILGVAARLLLLPNPWWHMISDPLLWSLLIGGGLAIVGYGFALDRGRVTTVAAVTFAVETIVPALIGLLWLGDAVRPGLWPLALLGFAATLAGCLTLAGRAEPQPALHQ